MKHLRRLGMLLFLPAIAFGHAGERLEPHDLWTAWSFKLGIFVPLALTALVYALGARVSRGVTRNQMVYFWSGWLFLYLSLLSPLHPLGEVLFSAHMAQHEVIMLAAAPLLVLSRPLVPMLWGLPFQWRRKLGDGTKIPVIQNIWRWLTLPAIAWIIHAIALWVWHAPALFQATLESEWVHAAQHLSFLGSALLFWWSLFFAHGRVRYGAAVLYLFTTGVHTSILGALLTFAPAVWYPAYASTAEWGLTPLEDQQIGGLVMWVPAGLVYMAAALTLLGMLLRAGDTFADKRELG